MTQPPKMSPLALQSRGIGITLSTSSSSAGNWTGLEALFADMGTILGYKVLLDIVPHAQPFIQPPQRPPPPACHRDRQSRRPRSDWATLQRLFPYLWEYKWRVIAALAFMVGAKLANVSVPLLLKELVDTMNPKGPIGAEALLVVPLGLLVAYGLLRLSTTLFAELRELMFAKATEGASRSISLQVFRHLHALSLRFHLERQTGGMTRDIERGTRAVHSLISYSLYSIFPTLIEVALVLSILAVKFDMWFAWITIIALVLYITLHHYGDRVAHPVPQGDERARLAPRTAAPSTRC